jgi:hypothetical protein
MVMGLQTTVIIRNDALGEIRRNPKEFVEHLCESIERVASGLDGHAGLDFGCGHHGNPARVVEVHHADTTVLISAGGCTASIIGTIVNRWRWPDAESKRNDVVMAVIDRFEELARKLK